MEDVKKTTLWDVLADKRIVVPVIQRDYAQGRESQFAKNVRERFVERLYEAVKEETKNPLCMDFVYFEKEGDKLIPVDGQQRLTTLWLFHVYHLTKENKMENKENKEENKKITKRLEQFTYEVRQTSKAFCKQLVEQRFEWFKALCKCEREECVCEKVICNQAWFFTAWRRDPTIMGMIRMLDTIHAKDQGKKLVANWWKGECLTFLDYTTQEKDLYCKMNARGKPLTPFENLKAYIDKKLFEMTEASDKAYTAKWKKNIDVDWADTLWLLTMKGATPDPQACDTALFTLTMTLLLLQYAKRGRPAPKEGEEKKAVDERWVDSVQSIVDVITSPENVLPSAFLEELTVKGSDWQAFLVEGFETVCQTGTQTSWVTTNWMKAPWNENAVSFADKLASRSLTYADFALLYAYVVKGGETGDWKRVIHNIVENTAISSTNLDSVIKLIHSLAKAEGLEDFVAVLKNASVAKDQCKEEAEKLNLLKDENWRAHIEEAEKKPWQKGRINFLLCQCNEGTEEKPSLDKFKDVLTYFAEQFKDEDSRLAWINQIWTRVETYCRNNGANAGNRFFIPRYVCRENEWSELKRFLYWKEWNNWQRLLLYKDIPLSDENGNHLVMDSVPLEWLSRLETVLAYYKQYPDPQGKIPHEQNLANRFGSLQRHGNGRIYLYVNDNVTNAICLDDTVDWWFKLYVEHQDWDWRWLTAGGIWITVECSFDGQNKHTFALIQDKNNASIQILTEEDDWYPQGKKAVISDSDTAPEAVVKVMKALVAKKFPKEKEA